MNQILKLSDWLLTWPVRLPFWLWERAGLGKTLAVLYVVMLCLSVFALSFAAVDAIVNQRTADPGPVVLPPGGTDTPTPTQPPAATDTATPTAPTFTATPEPAATETPTPMETPVPTLSPTPTPSVPATPTLVPTPTLTPAPTLPPTATDTVAPTVTPTEMPAPADTPTPTATATATPTAAPEVVHEAIVIAAATLRLGPGEAYPVVGNVEEGELVQVYARTESSEWLQVDPAGFTWIATQFVQLEGDLSEVEVASVIPPMPIPTDTPDPGLPAEPRQTATPTATVEEGVPAEPSALPSGGLGLFMDEWEAQFGEGVYDEASQRYAYLGGAEAGGLDVAFQDDLVRSIQIQFGEEGALAPDEVEMFVTRLIPADSELLETYMPEERPTATVAVYRSAWLAEQFGAEAAWLGEPGLFAVQIETEDGLVTALMVAADLAE